MPLSPAARGKDVIRLGYIRSTTISTEGDRRTQDTESSFSSCSIFFLELSPLIQLKEHPVLVTFEVIKRVG
jgi:hypothetical protein